MRLDFVNEIGRTLNIMRRDLIEKDLILHQILLDLSKNEFFALNFLFKGGSCLIKSYFGYLRFSEDIDFTWRDQSVFDGKSQKQVRAFLSKVIDETGSVFEGIAARRGLDFKYDKGDTDYIEFGGGNKTCTLKIWYASEITRHRSFLKVQINFPESMCFPAKRRKLRGLLTNGHAELKALFPEYGEYSRKISFDVYDVREILSEKVRALLTREGTKARDFLDIYLIRKRFGITPADVESCIVDKINFALRIYRKYRTNLKEKMRLLSSGKLFEWGQERDLLLSEINERDFYTFLKEFQEFLSTKIINQLNQRP